MSKLETQTLIKNRDTIRLQWVEPWPGLDANGNKFTATVALSATVGDCIAMQRAACDYLNKNSDTYKHRLKQSDEDLLLDFIALHWATVEE